MESAREAKERKTSEYNETVHRSRRATDRPFMWTVVVCWLLNVPATCKCISGADLLRQGDQEVFMRYLLQTVTHTSDYVTCKAAAATTRRRKGFVGWLAA